MPFRKEKSSGQFLIIARSAHGDRDIALPNQDFQRFFHRKKILLRAGNIVFHLLMGTVRIFRFMWTKLYLEPKY